jgi:hypothetical protein
MPVHDVADKVGDAALVGAIAAAIAALALACRTRGAKLDVRPTGFPRDANATLKKYENAYLQLVSKSAETPSLSSSEPSSAIEYALIAFEQAKGASKPASTVTSENESVTQSKSDPPAKTKSAPPVKSKSDPLAKPRRPDPGNGKGKKGGK